MSRFIIKEIVVSGESARQSRLEFCDGINIIYGPSNTGKSYILGCIDFIFGGNPPFMRSDTGYDTVMVRLESTDGVHYAELTRKIKEGKNGDIGESKVALWTNLEWGDATELKLDDNVLSNFLLHLMGVQEEHKIISSRDFKLSTFTLRTILHFFYLNEEHIMTQKPVLDNPEHKEPNKALAALIFLLTGNDLSAIVPTESKEERELRLARTSGVLNYLRNKLQQLEKQKADLQAQLDECNAVEEEKEIDALVESIANMERRIMDASSKSHELLAQIYALSSKLEEAQYLQRSYQSLHSQYESDIRRLRFMTDGIEKSPSRKKTTICPFCNGEIRNRQIQKIERHSVDAEIIRVQSQLQDLQLTEIDIEDQIEGIRERLNQLNLENTEVTNLIQQELRPQDIQLREKLSVLMGKTKVRQMLEDLVNQAQEMDAEIQANSNEQDGDYPVFEGKKQFSDATWAELSDAFGTAVGQCAYPGFMTAHLLKNTLDAEVNGKQKRAEGKGYRAYLNTLILFTLMRYLEVHAKYRPALLLLDSPILSLKEKNTVAEHELADKGMRSSLFKYILENVGQNQIILIENEIPQGVDYSSANMIEFTQSDTGRYGFLADVKVSQVQEETNTQPQAQTPDLE